MVPSYLVLQDEFGLNSLDLEKNDPSSPIGIVGLAYVCTAECWVVDVYRTNVPTSSGRSVRRFLETLLQRFIVSAAQCIRLALRVASFASGIIGQFAKLE